MELALEERRGVLVQHGGDHVRAGGVLRAGLHVLGEDGRERCDTRDGCEEQLTVGVGGPLVLRVLRLCDLQLDDGCKFLHRSFL